MTKSTPKGQEGKTYVDALHAGFKLKNKPPHIKESDLNVPVCEVCSFETCSCQKGQEGKKCKDDTGCIHIWGKTEKHDYCGKDKVLYYFYECDNCHIRRSSKYPAPDTPPREEFWEIMESYDSLFLPVEGFTCPECNHVFPPDSFGIDLHCPRCQKDGVCVMPPVIYAKEKFKSFLLSSLRSVRQQAIEEALKIVYDTGGTPRTYDAILKLLTPDHE